MQQLQFIRFYLADVELLGDKASILPTDTHKGGPEEDDSWIASLVEKKSFSPDGSLRFSPDILSLNARRFVIVRRNRTITQKIMNLFTSTFETLRDLYINELRDLYSAENQLVDALPKMAEAATAGELKRAFTNHLAQTQVHVQRLEQILQRLSEKPSGKTCDAMKGLIKEGESYISAGGNDAVRDAGLIGAAQRVEHYEIAGYGTARALAQQVGDIEAARILQSTLDEESAADELLTDIAESLVNPAAAVA